MFRFKKPAGDLCSHGSHHLLRHCNQAPYGVRPMCEKHLAACWLGCAPTRWIWWGPTIVQNRWAFGLDYTDDEYGNPGVLIRVPGCGVLGVYYPARMNRVLPDYEDYDDASGWDIQ